MLLTAAAAYTDDEIASVVAIFLVGLSVATALSLGLSYLGVVVGLNGRVVGFWSRVGLSIAGAVLGWFIHTPVSLGLLWALGRLAATGSTVLMAVSALTGVAALIGSGWVVGRLARGTGSGPPGV